MPTHCGSAERQAAERASGRVGDGPEVGYRPRRTPLRESIPVVNNPRSPVGAIVPPGLRESREPAASAAPTGLRPALDTLRAGGFAPLWGKEEVWAAGCVGLQGVSWT